MAGKSLAKLRLQLNQMGELYLKCGELNPVSSSKLHEKLLFIEAYKIEVETEIGAKVLPIILVSCLQFQLNMSVFPVLFAQ